MESFDVIIVGAGPAGLKCAETLGGSKFKVLLLEKNSEIGPKICAGGLTRKDRNYLNLPDKLIEFKSNKIKFHTNGKCSEIKYAEDVIYTINRKNLGQWQLKKLKKFKNIEVRTNARVSKIEKDYVVVENKKIAYNILVGADGSASIVRNYLKLKTKEVMIAIQSIIPNKKYREFEIFFNSKLFSTGYGWIFPHKKHTSIGCGCNIEHLNSKKITEYFNHWLEKIRLMFQTRSMNHL